MARKSRQTLVRMLGAAALAGMLACNGGTPTSPTTGTLDVSGIWTARITGTQQRTGAPQTDGARLILRQNAADVSGTMQYLGLSAAATVSGSVSDRVFNFTAAQSLAPDCSAAIDVTVSVSAAGNEMSGSYRAVTCEDTVIGTLTATRE